MDVARCVVYKYAASGFEAARRAGVAQVVDVRQLLGYPLSKGLRDAMALEATPRPQSLVAWTIFLANAIINVSRQYLCC